MPIGNKHGIVLYGEVHANNKFIKSIQSGNISVLGKGRTFPQGHKKSAYNEFNITLQYNRLNVKIGNCFADISLNTDRHKLPVINDISKKKL